MSYTGSKAFAGQGTQLERAGVTIGELTKIDRTGSKADSVDVTNMDSTGATREKIATLIEPGQVTFDGNLIPSDAGQQSVQSDFNGRTISAWRIQLPNALGRWDFNGFIESFDFSLNFDKAATFSSKVQITGLATFTPNV